MSPTHGWPVPIMMNPAAVPITNVPIVVGGMGGVPPDVHVPLIGAVAPEDNPGGAAAINPTDQPGEMATSTRMPSDPSDLQNPDDQNQVVRQKEPKSILKDSRKKKEAADKRSTVILEVTK